MAPYRVLIVDDSSFMRKVFSDRIEEDDGFTVAATASDGEEGVRLALELAPDLITMDLEMPRMNGLEALRRIMAIRPTPVIMLSAATDNATRDTIMALQYGAFDFIHKPDGSATDIRQVSEQLLEKLRIAVEAVSKGSFRVLPEPLELSEPLESLELQEPLETPGTLETPATPEQEDPDQSGGRAAQPVKIPAEPQAEPQNGRPRAEQPEPEPKQPDKKSLAVPVQKDATSDRPPTGTMPATGGQQAAKPAEPPPKTVKPTKLPVKGVAPSAPAPGRMDASVPRSGRESPAAAPPFDNRQAASDKPGPKQPAAPGQEKSFVPSATFAQLVAVGTSTGGPRALHELLTRLPGDFEAPVLVVQHMPPKFTLSLAQRLDSFCAIRVREATDGERLETATAYIAPGGKQMSVRKEASGTYCIKLTEEGPRNGHMPSVDVLFESLVGLRQLKRHTVLMTGMGSDGAKGMKALQEDGTVTRIAEAEETCVVYGMPRSAVELGAVSHQVPLQRIAPVLVQEVRFRNK